MSKLLTDEEQEVIKLLGTCFDKFIELEVLHPHHVDEFVLAIHSAQRIVMCRPVRREIRDEMRRNIGEEDVTTTKN
jgi:hypothetical protein